MARLVAAWIGTAHGSATCLRGPQNTHFLALVDRAGNRGVCRIPDVPLVRARTIGRGVVLQCAGMEHRRLGGVGVGEESRTRATTLLVVFHPACDLPSDKAVGPLRAPGDCGRVGNGARVEGPRLAALDR